MRSEVNKIKISFAYSSHKNIIKIDTYCFIVTLSNIYLIYKMQLRLLFGASHATVVMETV